MKETQIHQQDPIVIVSEQQERTAKLLKEMVPHPGHKLFSLNCETGIIDEVVIEKIDVVFPEDGKTISLKKRGKVTIKAGHLYTFALNMINAKKKFTKAVYG